MKKFKMLFVLFFGLIASVPVSAGNEDNAPTNETLNVKSNTSSLLQGQMATGPSETTKGVFWVSCMIIINCFIAYAAGYFFAVR